MTHGHSVNAMGTILSRVALRCLGLTGCGLVHGREWLESRFQNGEPDLETFSEVEDVEISRTESGTRFVMRIQSPDFRSAFLVGLSGPDWGVDDAELLDELRGLGACVVESRWLQNRNSRLEAEVSELDRTERLLRETEMHLREIIDAAPVVVVACDRERRVIFANRAAEQLTNRDREDLRGKPTELFDDDGTGFARVIAEGVSVFRDESIGNGESEFLAQYFPLFDAAGEVDAVCVIALDVSETARTRRELESVALQYRTLFQSTAEAMIIFDNATREILDVNDGVVQVTGVPRESLVGQSAEILSGMRQHGGKPLTGSIDEVMELEWPIRRADGTTRWFSVRMAPVDVEGVRRVIASGFDVTDRKAEEERRHLLEEDLRRAQKFDAVGRLAGGVAHDFNNLLSVILSYSELVQGELEEGEIKEDVRQIEEAARRAAVLTRQLLVLGRRDLSKPEAVNVNAHVSKIRELLGRSLGARIAFETDLTDVGSVWIDPGQLDQMLINLTVNAHDAMPQGGQFSIETWDVDEEEAQGLGLGGDGYVVISVSDTGEGISDEVIEHMFEPFFTTKNVAEGDGLGLGLAMVYGIVTGAGGQIRVKSDPETGTVFEIFLPTHDGEPARGLTSENTSSAEAGTLILVVEDEVSVLASVRRILESRGFDIITAANGADAIALAQEYGDEIDLLLSDVVMPGISGPELAERLRAMIPGMAVVFMSGYSDSVLPLDDFLETRTDLILKPFSRATLVDTVISVLNRQPSR